MSKELLQGKPIRHPLHPFLVHFPIGLFVFSFLLDAASYLVPPGQKLVAAAFYTMAAGVVTAILAAVPGLIDYLDIRTDHPAKRTATTHMTLNLIVVALYASNLGVRYSTLSAEQTELAPFILSISGIVLLSISGYLGGTLVYDDGIGVGRHRRRTPTPRETIHAGDKAAEGAGVPAASSLPIAVADVSAIGDGQTLRVSVRGQVLTIARLDGEYYAFQEFCTHRYGPLSEGCIHKGQVECPWHRSHFDVRTGKVTKGPAKVDLKSYAVEVRDGKVHVRV